VQTETYGIIQLNVFFMNQLRMTIELLKILGDSNLHNIDNDTELFNYSFDGVPELKTSKVYNWPISQDLLMS
jgi:hypothetical protein